MAHQQQQAKTVPVRMYQIDDRIMVAAPMPGLEPEDISVTIAGAPVTIRGAERGPGQRYDVIWTARQPGKWLIHCHIGHHTANNNVEMQGGGGLMMMIEVASA